MTGINTIFTKDDQINKLKVNSLVQSGHTVSMVLPLSFRLPSGSYWLFPNEPLISVSGRNTIVRRNVAKSQYRGTIKERWAQDDFTINIQGTLTGVDMETFPGDDFTTLYQAITQRTAISVKNDLLQLLDINQIVVESYDFPFTKGENVQNFTLTAYSDDLYELFIDVKNV
jgi:hypothetical protein